VTNVKPDFVIRVYANPADSLSFNGFYINRSDTTHLFSFPYSIHAYPTNLTPLETKSNHKSIGAVQKERERESEREGGEEPKPWEKR
jgi:hypothetical protein